MRKSQGGGYIEVLKERIRKSRAYTPYQSHGLDLAEILKDKKHKTLYMKLAKQYEPEILFSLAHDVVQRKNVRNRAAYFMKVFAKIKRNLVPKTLPRKPRQLKLKLKSPKRKKI